MAHLTQQVLPLALGAAFSPTILAISLLILSGPHGRGRMIVFTVANVATLALIGVVWVFLFKHSTGDSTDSAKQAASAAVDTTLGVILLIIGLRAWLREPRPKEEHDTSAKEPELVRYGLLGVVMMLSNLTTLALFLPASKEIALSHLALPGRAAVLAMLVVIATVTSWGPLLLSIAAPATATRVLGGIDRFTTRHAKPITVIVCFAFGTYLIIKGMSA